MTSNHLYKKANAAYLMGAFCVIVLKKPAYEVSRLFSFITIRFRDASDGPCFFFLSLAECFSAIEQAIRRNWFSYSTFSSADYDFYAQLENGDLNWIIPRQFVAFSSPADDHQKRKQRLTAEKYSVIFRDLNVRTVIRLNKPKYSACKFVERGINHYDLHFKDGSTPSINLVDNFIDICNSEHGAVAVHCKAGLGRTGTLIGCYAIRIFKFPAAAFIAWCRLCRPGSILGPQQQFLLDYEDSVRNKKKFMLNTISYDSLKATLGDNNQGKRLIEAKSRNSTPNPKARRILEVKSTANSESNSFEEEIQPTPRREERKNTTPARNNTPARKTSQFIQQFKKIVNKFAKPEESHVTRSGIFVSQTPDSYSLSNVRTPPAKLSASTHALQARRVSPARIQITNHGSEAQRTPFERHAEDYRHLAGRSPRAIRHLQSFRSRQE
jgi:protein-tyrosine phosphatase